MTERDKRRNTDVVPSLRIMITFVVLPAFMSNTSGLYRYFNARCYGDRGGNTACQ